MTPSGDHARGGFGPTFRRALLLSLLPAALVALLSGLARMAPPLGGSTLLGLDHGALFVMGVFGSVIGLERATATDPRRAWPLLAPSASVVGAWLLVSRSSLAPPVVLLGAAGVSVLDVRILARQRQTPNVLMLLASLALVASAVLRWVDPARDVSALWLAFLVGTILAERLELSRLAPRPWWAEPFLVVTLLAQLGAALVVGLGSVSARAVVGLTFIAAAGWAARFDVAGRLVHRAVGLARFVAIGVLSALAWLGVSGAIQLTAWALALAGSQEPPHARDAYLHACLVGFVLSMVMAHALLILPAVARVQLRFSPLSYVPLALLHLSVATRVCADLGGWSTARVLGGLGHVLALALFGVSVGWGMRSSRSTEGGSVRL